jgi:hypothetical protein
MHLTGMTMLVDQDQLDRLVTLLRRANTREAAAMAEELMDAAARAKVREEGDRRASS